MRTHPLQHGYSSLAGNAFPAYSLTSNLSTEVPTMKNHIIGSFLLASRVLRPPLICSCLIWAVLIPQVAQGEDWPQWRGPNRDGVWRESGIVSELPERLNFKWRMEIGQGYAGPAVVGNRLYVTDLVSAPQDRSSGGNRERVLCLDAGTGATLWKHEYACDYEISYPQGPRTTPTVDQGKVYTLGAMGDLICLDAATGEVQWSRNYIRDFGAQPPVWGFSAAPLVDGRKLIVIAGGSENRCVMALDKETGREIWRSLEADEPGYSAPVIFEFGGARQLIIWNPKGLYGLDPETGQTYWSREFPAVSYTHLTLPTKRIV